MKPSAKLWGLLSLSILVCAASVKTLSHYPLSLSRVSSLPSRSQQLLSYAWVRMTNPPKYGTLRWDVQQAKLHGTGGWRSTSIGMCCEFNRDSLRPLQDALSTYSLIVAEPTLKNTYADENQVKTWYKFKVIETLNSRPMFPCAGCFTSPYLLKDLPPIATDEIAILEDGGTMTIDGISISHGSNYSVRFSLFRKYLMFLQMDPAKKMGFTTREGVFTIGGTGELSPVAPEPSSLLQKYILERDQNSLDQLKADIENSSKTKK
jgi:hypothetical protein